MQPFTLPAHEALRVQARAFADAHDGAATADRAPALVRALGDASLLAVGLPSTEAAATAALALVVLREELARASALVDALFAVQALVALPIAAAGDPAMRARWLPALASGAAVGAFALTEVEAGSDLGALSTTARRDGPGGGYRLDGEKCLISNAGIASVYVVFARTGGPDDRRPLSAFVVPAEAPGLSTTPVALAVAHPIGNLRLEGVRLSESARLGAEGDGLRLALATLTLMRPTVGAAACGLARRALDEACAFVRRRRTFGQALVERDSVQMALADMATSLDAARLLVYRAAWLHDGGGAPGSDERFAAESSMAKLFATEAAQQIVDRAVQLHGGRGVVQGVTVERLYREVRALRIYEGTSEIHKLIIARGLLGR
ncbi:MAG TPA: acyl-CoA dehydrogenase family protein [Polyangia bacterium]|jgi:acyl-CoA dehydrogenase|nr:acyl-CoA dehydrogenase family protein [Polyangia bacterium]